MKYLNLNLNCLYVYVHLFSGGTFGIVVCELRSVGGGEPWDYDVAVTPASTNDTIGQALANRDIRIRALEQRDYSRLNTSIVFEVRHCYTLIGLLLPKLACLCSLSISPIKHEKSISQW